MPQISKFFPHKKTNIGSVGYAHSLSLGGGTVGDLLNAELVKLELQLLELLGKLLLVLAPELTSLDLGRLQKKRGSSALQMQSVCTAEHTMVALNYVGCRR
jgi:hypothetical protein